MSAIWGHIDFINSACSVETMDAEFKRKCKLDAIREIHHMNSLFGFGLQLINEEDNLEELPYILDDGKAVVADAILDNREELKNKAPFPMPYSFLSFA